MSQKNCIIVINAKMGPILEKALSNLFVRYSVLKAHALFTETVYLSINIL